jgi:hypothetical protein
MNGSFRSLAARVAGGRLAYSAQPPPAPPRFYQNASSLHRSQPTRSLVFGDTPGALLEGLRCFTASRPLLNPRSDVRKKPSDALA